MLKDIEQILNSLNRSELIAVNKMIINRIKIMDDLQRLAQISRFYPGQKVSWKGYDGVIRFGRILRINRKTVSIHEENDEGGIWKVSSSLLTEAV